MISIDLSGKAALVTGASQGLGAVTAARLHAAGAQVAIGFLDDTEGHNRQMAEAVASDLGERSGVFGGGRAEPG